MEHHLGEISEPAALNVGIITQPDSDIFHIMVTAADTDLPAAYLDITVNMAMPDCTDHLNAVASVLDPEFLEACYDKLLETIDKRKAMTKE